MRVSIEGKELATGVYENKTTRLEVSCLAMGQVAVVSILHEVYFE